MFSREEVWFSCKVVGLHKGEIRFAILTENFDSVLRSHSSILSGTKFGKGEGIAVPLQAWSDLEGSRNLRFPDFMTTAQDGGKVVSLTHRPPLPPGNTPGTHFW